MEVTSKYMSLWCMHPKVKLSDMVTVYLPGIAKIHYVL